MSATSQPTDFSDLYTDLQNRVREETGVVATENIAKRFINIALQDMHVGYGERFPWAERQATLITQPDYTTGTVSINKGSTTLTGSGTSWATNNDFSRNNARATGKVVINGGTDVYTISSVDSDTQITLNEMFTEADVSGVDYVYFEDEYDVSADFLRPLDLTFFDQNHDIPLIGRNEFRRRYPRNKTAGKPQVATIVDRSFSGSTTPVRRVRFWKPPDDAYMIRYSFVTNKLAVTSGGSEQTSLSNDTDEPIVPLQFRHVIVFHALYHYYRDRKDDDRAGAAKGEYTDLMIRITADHEIGRNRPKIEPRVSHYVGKARRPYRRRGGTRYTTGDAFDQNRI